MVSSRNELQVDAKIADRKSSLLTDQDLYLFNEGSHYRMYEKLGAHLVNVDGAPGTQFGVWAPAAREVSVIGDFNGWDRHTNVLRPRGSSGIWEGFIPGLQKGALYKFHISSHQHGYRVDKADPFGILHEKPPRTASVVWDLDYQWEISSGWNSVISGIHCMLPKRFTRCTWARGCELQKSTIAR